jgi:uncharacterized membrane protein (Fun14 family)
VSEATPATAPESAFDAAIPASGAPEARPWFTLPPPVVRWARRVLAVVVAVVAALLVSLFTLDLGSITINGKSLKSLAESRGAEFLGREFTIGRISALLSPGNFLLEDVVIGGATPGSTPFMTAKSIQVHVPWWTILLRREAVVEVRMDGWRMVTELFPDKRPILPNLRPRGPSRPGGNRYIDRTTVKIVDATRGEFVYRDHMTPWSVVCRNLNFTLVRSEALGAYVGAATFSNGTVQIQDFLPMRADFATRFALDQQGRVRLEHIELVTDGARTHLNGMVDFKNWPEQTYNIDSTVDFPRMREIFFRRERWALAGAGRFQGIFHLYKDGRDLTGRFTSHELTVNDLRLTDLDGSLAWLKDRFTVSDTRAGFYGGDVRLAYGLEPLGSPGGAGAKFHADVSGADLAAFRREFSWRGLQPQGRLDGDLQLHWRNGRFSESAGGGGHFSVTPPAGSPALARAELPPEPSAPRGADLAEDPPFDKYLPHGPFPMGARVGFDIDPDGLTFEPSWAANPSTLVRFSGRSVFGGAAEIPFHVTSYDWQASDRLLAAILTAITREPTGAIQVAGRGTFDGVMTKTFSRPRIAGRFSGENIKAWDVVWGRASGDLVIEDRYLDITNGMIGDRPEASIQTDGRFSMGYPRADGGEQMRAKVRIAGWSLADVRHAFEQDDWPVDGTIGLANLDLHGEYEHLQGSGDLRIDKGLAWDERFESASGQLAFDGRGVDISDIRMEKGGGTITGAADLRWDGTYSFEASGERVPVQSLDNFKFTTAPLTGLLKFGVSGAGAFDNPSYSFRGEIADLFIGDEGVGFVDGEFRVQNRVLAITSLNVTSSRLQVFGLGSIALNDASDAALSFTFTNSSLDPYLKFFAPTMSPYARAIASGRIQIDGPLAAEHVEDLRVEATIDPATLTLIDFFGEQPVADYELKNEGVIRLRFEENAFRIPAGGFVLVGRGTRLELAGSVDRRAGRMDLDARGRMELALLQLLFPGIAASGDAEVNARYAGASGQEQLSGRAEIKDGRLRIAGLTQTLNLINGPIAFSADGVDVSGLRARFGESDVVFGGTIAMERMRFVSYDLTATGRNMVVRYPQGLTSLVDADLEFRGPVEAPTLGGEVTVRRATYRAPINANAPLLSLAAGGAIGGGGDVPLPPTESTLPVRLNIHINADSTEIIRNTEATIVARADFNLIGTIARPILRGLVELESGFVQFGANRLLLLPGTILVENNQPVFDIEAVTRPRFGGQTYDIGVRIRGTFDKLEPTLTSDPWLPQGQIWSVLLGGVPTDTDRLSEVQGRLAPQEAQRAALAQATAVLITSPLTSTIGSVVKKTLPGVVDTVQLTPLLNNQAGEQFDPGVRLTVSKRIGPKVVLTYSRALNQQYEIILVEYDQTDRLSWVLSRNEDRSFALDFRIRHVF